MRIPSIPDFPRVNSLLTTKKWGRWDICQLFKNPLFIAGVAIGCAIAYFIWSTRTTTQSNTASLEELNKKYLKVIENKEESIIKKAFLTIIQNKNIDKNLLENILISSINFKNKKLTSEIFTQVIENDKTLEMLETIFKENNLTLEEKKISAENERVNEAFLEIIENYTVQLENSLKSFDFKKESQLKEIEIKIKFLDFMTVSNKHSQLIKKISTFSSKETIQAKALPYSFQYSSLLKRVFKYTEKFIHTSDQIENILTSIIKNSIEDGSLNKRIISFVRSLPQIIRLHVETYADLSETPYGIQFQRSKKANPNVSWDR